MWFIFFHLGYGNLWNTALEALSCGLPIILNSHKSGEHASEIIPASKNHYKLIPKDDKDALISANYTLELVDFGPVEFLAADLDGSGLINVFDILLITDLSDQ